MGSDGGTGNSFWKRLLRTLKNLVIAALIIIPCLFAVKIRLRLDDINKSVDSLRSALNASYRTIDSLKTIQDEELLTRDCLDDLVDRKLGDRATEAMFTMDTTVDASIAREAIQASMDLDNWVDSLRAPYPEGVSAQVKLRYLQSRANRLERLQHHYSERFGNSIP